MEICLQAIKLHKIMVSYCPLGCIHFYIFNARGPNTLNHKAPFAKNGHLWLPNSGRSIRIKQIQIEQDTAKSITNKLETVYDLNRAGTPLLEIVTLPDIESADEAGEYVRSLQSLLRGIAVGDGMMEAVSDINSSRVNNCF